MKTRLVIGCGYLGRRVAERWRTAGDKVFAVTRSPSRADEFRQLGWLPIVADVNDPHTLATLPSADTVLYAVGYDRDSGRSMRDVYVFGLRTVLDSLADESLTGKGGRLIYISSTSVYGQSDGGWVDEDSLCEPTRENGRVCLEAEQTLRGHPLADRSIILRLAGIYGPGRLPNRQALLAGEPLVLSEAGSLNLIHVEDAAGVVLAAVEHADPSPIYVVCDGHPVERRAYYAEAARLLRAPPPRFVPPPEGSVTASTKAQRGEANRQLNNARMLKELGVRLTYPSFREGLAAALVPV